MGMDDGNDIGPCRKDRGMDKALEIEAAAVVADRLTIQIEFEDVFGADQLRGERARDQEMVGLSGWRTLT